MFLDPSFVPSHWSVFLSVEASTFSEPGQRRSRYKALDPAFGQHRQSTRLRPQWQSLVWMTASVLKSFRDCSSSWLRSRSPIAQRDRRSTYPDWPTLRALANAIIFGGLICSQSQSTGSKVSRFNPECQFGKTSGRWRWNFFFLTSLEDVAPWNRSPGVFWDLRNENLTKGSIIQLTLFEIYVTVKELWGTKAEAKANPDIAYNGLRRLPEKWNKKSITESWMLFKWPFPSVYVSQSGNYLRMR